MIEIPSYLRKPMKVGEAKVKLRAVRTRKVNIIERLQEAPRSAICERRTD